jgi:hypothetical protein
VLVLVADAGRRPPLRACGATRSDLEQIGQLASRRPWRQKVGTPRSVGGAYEALSPARKIRVTNATAPSTSGGSRSSIRTATSKPAPTIAEAM